MSICINRSNKLHHNQSGYFIDIRYNLIIFPYLLRKIYYLSTFYRQKLKEINNNIWFLLPTSKRIFVICPISIPLFLYFDKEYILESAYFQILAVTDKIKHLPNCIYRNLFFRKFLVKGRFPSHSINHPPVDHYHTLSTFII